MDGLLEVSNEGFDVGVTEGSSDGDNESCNVGVEEGSLDGCADDTKLGGLEGNTDGSTLGWSDDTSDGISDGIDDGSTLGWSDGTSDGISDGIDDGNTLGIVDISFEGEKLVFLDGDKVNVPVGNEEGNWLGSFKTVTCVGAVLRSLDGIIEEYFMLVVAKEGSFVWYFISEDGSTKTDIIDGELIFWMEGISDLCVDGTELGLIFTHMLGTAVVCWFDGDGDRL